MICRKLKFTVSGSAIMLPDANSSFPEHKIGIFVRFFPRRWVLPGVATWLVLLPVVLICLLLLPSLLIWLLLLPGVAICFQLLLGVAI